MPRRKHVYRLGPYFLDKRPNSPNWCVCWYDRASRSRNVARVSLGTEDADEAKRLMDAWYMRNAQYRDVEAERMPLKAVLDRYLDRRGQEIADRERAERARDGWLAFWGEQAVAADLTAARFEDFHKWMREARRWKASNGNRTLRVGRAALRSAVKRQELRWAPDVPMMREEEPEERPVLSIEQLARLWDAIEADHLRTYVVVALCTLGRPEAILDLTRDQIDFDRRILRFNAPGRRQTRKRRPEVPVCDALLPWLRRAGPGYVVSYNGRQVASLKTAFRAAVRGCRRRRRPKPFRARWPRS